MSQKSFLCWEIFLEFFLNLPEWLKWTMLYAVIATAYLTSSFPLTVSLWKDFLSDEVYIPPHFLFRLCCIQWGFYNEYITYVCFIKGIRWDVQSHSFREYESFKEIMNAFEMAIRMFLWNLVCSSFQNYISG